jgi:hypothetical protein
LSVNVIEKNPILQGFSQSNYKEPEELDYGKLD